MTLYCDIEDEWTEESQEALWSLSQDDTGLMRTLVAKVRIILVNVSFVMLFSVLPFKPQYRGKASKFDGLYSPLTSMYIQNNEHPAADNAFSGFCTVAYSIRSS